MPSNLKCRAVEGSGGHAHRLEHLLSHDVLESVARHALDDDADERVAGVRVEEDGARCGRNVGVPDDCGKISGSDAQRLVGGIEHPGGVSEELVHGASAKLALRAELREVSRDRALRIEQPFLHQPSGRRRREHLGERGQRKQRVEARRRDLARLGRHCVEHRFVLNRDGVDAARVRSSPAPRLRKAGESLLRRSRTIESRRRSAVVCRDTEDITAMPMESRESPRCAADQQRGCCHRETQARGACSPRHEPTLAMGMRNPARPRGRRAQ